MKATKITYWITTGLIFLFEGLMPALTSHTELAREGIAHLGYPEYFGPMLTVLKVIGSLVLILPMIPGRFKEWAYACFAVEFVCAFYSHAVVDGINGQTFFPLLVFMVLITSYVSYHKLNKAFVVS